MSVPGTVLTQPGLPVTMQGGLFATSPEYSRASLGVSAIDGSCAPGPA